MLNPKTDEYYLNKVISDIDFIIESMNGVTLKRFQRNVFLSDSMSFRLIQIQENAKKISDEFKKLHPDIPWNDIAGLRNRIVHDYGSVILDNVYDTLTKDIPELKKSLAK